MGGRGKHPILVAASMNTGVTESRTTCFPNGIETTPPPPQSERKRLTDRNTAPEIRGCNPQEQREGGTERGHSKGAQQRQRFGTMETDK